jgi:hypothetical protein
MRVAILLVAAGVIVVAACSGSDATGVPLQGDDSGGGGGDASMSSLDGGGCQPGPTPQPEDPSKLPSCCTEGAAHCVSGSQVPPAEAAQLATCSGGYCVPDVFIKDPSHVPATCTAFNMTPGVCLSVCIPQVHQYESILQQGTCASDERCAPCTNPLNMQSSGACNIGKQPHCGDGDAGPPPPPMEAGPPACPHTGPPVIDPSKLPLCDPKGGAHCLDKSLVPMAEQSQLAACGSTTLCVPDSFIESGGNFIPPTCASLVGAEGRCLDEMIPQVAAQASQLPQSSCQPFERCVPCYSPLDGTDTGACKLSCDPGPKDPPKLFANCCSSQARCIPTSEIPMSEQSNLGADTCKDPGTLCVPSEMLKMPFTPEMCSGQNLFGAYDGVCLSKCLKFSFIQQLGIDHGTCSDPNHDCAPCTNPLTGQPTGAPGCM